MRETTGPAGGRLPTVKEPLPVGVVHPGRNGNGSGCASMQLDGAGVGTQRVVRLWPGWVAR
jgi:hypothetical protein